jgi:excisionase family DNA binding protein
MIPQLLSVKELAARLGLAEYTVYEWVSEKRIPYTKVGRRTMFDPAEIARWLEQHTVREQHPSPLLDHAGRRRPRQAGTP